MRSYPGATADGDHMPGLVGIGRLLGNETGTQLVFDPGFQTPKGNETGTHLVFDPNE